jgi:2-polyprenyl-6-hydroxyphenyl methylase/3-demethylubiquinone-9 3-methyltransferase
MAEYVWEDLALPCSAPFLFPAVKSLMRDVPAGSTVVDFGCGNGSLLAQLRSGKWDLHGLDMSLSGVTIAQHAYPEIAFDVADLTADLSNHKLAGYCDVVVSTEVVEHVFLPRVFARNCYALLKPKGRFIVTTPYHGYLKDLALAVMGKMDEQYTALWDFGHIKFWSRKTLTKLLVEAGFEVVEFRGLGRSIPWLWKNMLLVAVKP